MGFFSFLTPVKKAAGTVEHQAKTLGWNFLKSVPKPFVATGADISNTIGNVEVKGAHALGLAPNVQTETNKQQYGDTLGNYVGENNLKNFGANAGLAALTFLAPEAVAGKVVAPIVEKAGIAGTAAKLATAAGTGATIGAPFGGLDAVTQDHPTVEGILKGIGYGAAGGAFLGTAGETAHLAIHNARPLNEVGSIGKNVSDEEVGKIQKASSPDEIKPIIKDTVPDNKIPEVTRSLSVATDPHAIRSIIQNAKSDEPVHVQKFVRDYGDALKQMETGLTGGGKTTAADGTQVRTSEHSPFYRSFYKENNKAPSIADYHAEAERQLKTGKADSFAQREYDALKNPEVASLLHQPDSYFAQDNRVGEASTPAPQALAEPTLDQLGGQRPNNTIQSQIEAAHNAGDDNQAATLIQQLPTDEQSSMRSALGIEEPSATSGTTRGFAKTSESKDMLNSEVQKGLKATKTNTYTPRSNGELIAKTKKIVDTKEQEAVQKVFEGADTPARHDENVALGGHLIQKAQREGRIEDAVRIAERLNIQGTELGRGVQAYAAIHRLSPEGILLYAQKQIRRARESNKDFVHETPTASEIKKQVEAFSEKDAPIVKAAIKDVVNRVAGTSDSKLSTGEKLANRVDKAAQPAVSKKTNILLNELTKKVKQEYLDPKVSVKTPPIKILQEVFGRGAEAAKAYPEAQSILRSKYAGDEQMSKALDKFFGSDLGNIPAASTTIDKAIQNQLRDHKVQVMKAVYKSFAEQKQTVADVTQALTKEGFDTKSAGILAKEVTERLNKQFADAKARALERLSKDATPKAQQTYLDKVAKLSNIGALDKSDYIDLARAKLNLPNLSPDTATKLSELSQHLQTLPEGADKYAAIRQLRQLIEKNTPLTGKQKLTQAFGTSRALLASGDISFGGRQAISYATAHPIKFAQQWAKQFKFFKEGFKGDDSRAFDELMGQIQSHKDYDLLKKSGLAITDPFGISPSAREEQFIGSNYAERIPAIGRLVRGSDYAFTGLANSLRSNEFYGQIEQARNAGIPLTEKLVNDLAEVINTSTGRGNVKFLEDHMKSLSTAMFAPRLVISRLQMFNPQYYLKLEPLARKEALRHLISFSGFAVGLLTAAKLAGLDVGTNPKSSDFGKIKVGDTRLDFLGGYTQYIRLGAQLSTGESISSVSGRTSDVGTGFGDKSRKDIIAKFLENKENPVLSFATTLLSGKDAVGNTVSSPKQISKQVINRFVPLVFQDVADMETHDKALNPLIGAPLAAVGVGTQTYGKQDIQLSDKQQQQIDALKSSSAPKGQIKAYKDFYQSSKTTPDRQAASDAINEALKTQDYDKAEKIAADFNKQYAAAFKDWAKNYSQYEDATLSQAYNSGKINLTGDNIRTRLTNIRKNQLTSATLGGN